MDALRFEEGTQTCRHGGRDGTAANHRNPLHAMVVKSIFHRCWKILTSTPAGMCSLRARHTRRSRCEGQCGSF